MAWARSPTLAARNARRSFIAQGGGVLMSTPSSFDQASEPGGSLASTATIAGCGGYIRGKRKHALYGGRVAEAWSGSWRHLYLLESIYILGAPCSRTSGMLSFPSNIAPASGNCGGAG